MTTISQRSAGILLHITSLPGPFGAGDLGPSAYHFADQLHLARQRYWQVLPVNPLHPEHLSPYSPISSMAGEPLLISPELLAKEGLLTPAQLSKCHLSVSDQVDFAKAIPVKGALLEIAYLNFVQTQDQSAFENYCREQAHWLDEFTDIQREKWYQFKFDQQWVALKSYCNDKGILLFGDLPFYMHGNACDVKAHPAYFNLNGVGGVPPDYFSETGQCWNVPVYDWDALKADNYSWWIRRIKRNLERFDIIRLDHFRAFSAYWEIPAGEPTAVNGQWKPGPGADLFEKFKALFPTMPFIAEDLGTIDAPVRALQEQFNLKGMRVLQFGFGKDMPESDHAPHHFISNVVAVTGTHDNNTSRGWYEEDADRKTRLNFREYTGLKIAPKKVARILSRMAYSSIADIVILPMQDVLELSGDARMNHPSGSNKNWKWRMMPGQFKKKKIKRLKKWVKVYGRR
ncbi:4-alpha-glucanotransferase [[Flexibacter] sp. ATCC 35208]|uniref:4-alpha-glucanotransferase n=1 Tax=[Flexibacter] sp. ATCC 35208 TaxID=1936242 RepID=UPI0009CBCEFC|nr:4-alpha-glucanotransferase [[Flexibacter] sp. ATCC 35208]OMP80857.1 4-alpha-glucanotransferase [[Flexibacter] sp. ATCC 35208]